MGMGKTKKENNTNMIKMVLTMKENNINMIGKGLNREGKECHMHENYDERWKDKSKSKSEHIT